MTLEKWERISNIPLFALSAVFLFAYSWQILAQTHLTACFIAINVVWITYGIDYLVSFILAEHKWLWFRRNILLLLTLALPIFRPLRLLRLIPMLHIFNRSAGAATRGRITIYATSAISLLIYVAALAEYSAEHLAPGATITTFPLSLWWAFVTVTTVGYGDVYPVTLTGRFIAIALMLTGIALIGIVSAMISSWIIDQVNGGARNITKDDAPATGTRAQSDNDYNSADIRLMRAEILRLTDTVGQLNHELQRTHRLTKRAHRRVQEHHGNVFLDEDGRLRRETSGDAVDIDTMTTTTSTPTDGDRAQAAPHDAGRGVHGQRRAPHHAGDAPQTHADGAANPAHRQ
ncbi:potassium channel family protein [Bifidobacterium choerinum]|uniref:potassium channel family protein n=1 Tax=Bifidobacterium choerinum TaxID=35760 RepID=UPI003F91A1ED